MESLIEKKQVEALLAKGSITGKHIRDASFQILLKEEAIQALKSNTGEVETHHSKYLNRLCTELQTVSRFSKAGGKELAPVISDILCRYTKELELYNTITNGTTCRVIHNVPNNTQEFAVWVKMLSDDELSIVAHLVSYL
jgi:hypothetical protein